MGRFVFVIAALLAFSASSYAQQPGRRVESREPRFLSLDKDDVTILSCSRSSVVRPGVCFNGISEKPGCGGNCGYCIVQGIDAIQLNCDYKIDGIVIDETNVPIAKLPIQLIMLGSDKFQTSTDAEGRFHLSVKASGGKSDMAPRCLVQKSFGKMPSIRDFAGIALLGEISAQKMASHPELSCVRKPIEQFDGTVFAPKIDGSKQERIRKTRIPRIEFLDIAR